MIALLIFIIVIFFMIIIFVLKPIVKETVRSECKKEVKLQVYAIINEFTSDIKDLSIKSKHTDKAIDPIKVLDLVIEKINKIDKI